MRHRYAQINSENWKSNCSNSLKLKAAAAAPTTVSVNNKIIHVQVSTCLLRLKRAMPLQTVGISFFATHGTRHSVCLFYTRFALVYCVLMWRDLVYANVIRNERRKNSSETCASDFRSENKSQSNHNHTAILRRIGKVPRLITLSYISTAHFNCTSSMPVHSSSFRFRGFSNVFNLLAFC